jgi:hypothetical protein
MIVVPTSGRRFQVSVRTLLIVIAVLALLLMPAALLIRQQQAARWALERAMHAELLARREQDRAANALAQRQSIMDSIATSPQEEVVNKGDVPLDPAKADQIDQLRRENAELRAEIDVLRREMKRIRGAKSP